MSATSTPRRRPPTNRLATVGVLVAAGILMSGAALIGGEPSLALIFAVFYLVCAVAAYFWSGRSGDIAAIMRTDGDERQKSLDLRATAFSAFAMGAFAIGGTLVSLALGEPGETYAAVAAVGGASYVLALLVLKARG